MDFDAFTSSPEFASVMENPLKLAAQIDNTLSKQQQLVSSEESKPSAGPEGLLLSSDNLSLPASLLGSPLPISNHFRGESPLQVVSSSSPTSDELFIDESRGSPKVQSRGSGVETVPNVPNLPVAEPLLKEQTVLERNSLKSAPELPVVEDSKKRHSRISSKTAIPLHLPTVLKQRATTSETKDLSQWSSSEIITDPVDAKGKQADSGQDSKSDTRPTVKKSSLLSWANEMVARATYGDASPKPFPFNPEEEEEDSASGSFVSAGSALRPNNPGEDLTFTSYSDIAKAFSTLSNQVLSLETKLIRHERECSSDMAAISHRAGANWSRSSLQGGTKTVTEPASVVAASENSNNQTAPQVAIKVSSVSTETVASLVSSALREHASLPPRVALARARALLLSVHQCSDSHKYSALPGQLDQMIQVLNEETLSGALNRMS